MVALYRKGSWTAIGVFYRSRPAASLRSCGGHPTTSGPLSRIDILRATIPGERYSTVPCVNPGGGSLLRLSGWPKVERVLQAIDAVEAAGVDPVEACPDHWRHVHNRLTAGQEPRPYLRERHAAWLKRRRSEP